MVADAARDAVAVTGGAGVAVAGALAAVAVAVQPTDAPAASSPGRRPPQP